MRIMFVEGPEFNFNPILLKMREISHCDVVVINRVSSRLNEYNAEHFLPRMDFNLDQFIKAAEAIKIESCELEKTKQVFPHAVNIKQFAKSQCQKTVTTFRRSR